MPKISIITPCYNAENYIAATIASVRAQTLIDWEHIVVDDGSTDGSATVVAALAAEEPRLRLVRQKNGGVSWARNHGFAECAPDSALLLFLDADDCLEPALLATLADYLDAHAEVGLAYCDCRVVDSSNHVREQDHGGDFWAARFVPDGQGLRRLPPETPETPFVSIFVLTRLIPSLAVLRRSVYQQAGGWDEAFGQPCEDTDLFLRMALAAPVHYVPRILLRYRMHGGQSTTNEQHQRTQEEKLYAKWIQKADDAAAGSDGKRIMAEAIRFREGRFVPYLGWHYGRIRLQKKQWLPALRFFGGALRRYCRWWLMPRVAC